MSRTLFRTGLVLILLGTVAQRARALEPAPLSNLNPFSSSPNLKTDKWCRINNESNKDYYFTISDWKVVVGDIYLKPANESGSGIKLSTANATTALNAHSSYLCYFDTTANTFGLSFTISSGDDSTEFNLKRAPVVGDRLVISPKNGRSLSAAPITINLQGFRRYEAPAFITIH